MVLGIHFFRKEGFMSTVVASPARKSNHKGNVAPAQPPAMPMLSREDEMDHRLMVLHEYLMAGLPRPELLALAQSKWGIGRRQAYAYLDKLRLRMDAETCDEGERFVGQLTQMKRD